MVRGREDVDCEWSGADAARVIAGGLGQWHGVAGREDSDGDGGGERGGGERRRVGEQDDDEFGDARHRDE